TAAHDRTGWRDGPAATHRGKDSTQASWKPPSPLGRRASATSLRLELELELVPHLRPYLHVVRRGAGRPVLLRHRVRRLATVDDQPWRRGESDRVAARFQTGRPPVLEHLERAVRHHQPAAAGRLVAPTGWRGANFSELHLQPARRFAIQRHLTDHVV